MNKLIGKGLRILILDDEEDICHFSREFFERRGFEVYTSLTGNAALNTINKVDVDIAILDIYLYKGNISGIDVLKSIQEKQPKCQCIMLTRDDNETVIKETKKIGAVDYLMKPLTLEKVEKAVTKVVNKIRKGGK